MNLNSEELINEIEEEYLNVIRTVDSVTHSKYFVIGALVRDIHMYNINDFKISERITGDVDLAICVESWERFKEVKDILIQSHGYRDCPKGQPQKVISPEDVQVDILPFGELTSDNEIRWPDSKSVMSVVGFEDANNNLWSIKYNDFELKIVSIEMFTVLKIVSWNDRKDREKDITDIVYVVKNYINIKGNKEKVRVLGLPDKYSDLNHMSIALLGSNICEQIQSETKALIIEIIDDGMTDNKTKPLLIKKFISEYPPHSFPASKKLLEVFRESFN